MAWQPYTPHHDSHEEVQIHATAHEQLDIQYLNRQDNGAIMDTGPLKLKDSLTNTCQNLMQNPKPH